MSVDEIGKEVPLLGVDLQYRMQLCVPWDCECPCRACSGGAEGLDVVLVPAEHGVQGDGMSSCLLGQ